MELMQVFTGNGILPIILKKQAKTDWKDSTLMKDFTENVTAPNVLKKINYDRIKIK